MASKFDSIYTHLPIWGQNVALSLYGLHLRRLRYGKAFVAELASLRESERMSKAELEDLQTRRLRSLLQHAIANVPYYRIALGTVRDALADITLKNFAERVPTLPKQLVRDNPDDFVAADNNEQLVTLYTSGTSGSPLPVRTTRNTVQRNYAFFARYLGWHGVAPWDHGCTFAGRLIVPEHQRKPPFWRRNLAMDTLLCSSYHLAEQWLGDYVDALSEFKPQFIDSYPSAISVLATFINQNRLQHDILPRTIITSSETLLANQREDIEIAFGCKVRDHYGCAEMAALITQCEHGTYHVNPEFGIVEVLRDDDTPCSPGEAGNLCCTGFLNERMPLIRYKIGDRAQLSDEGCECGRQFPVVSELLGRLDDQVITPDGRQVGRLDPAFKGGAGIVEAQIVQNELASVDVYVVADSSFDKGAEEKLVAELQRRLSPSMAIRVTKVQHIERQRNGKLRAVICNLRSANRN